MSNSLLKVGIVCPCDIEYAKCKGILKLSNESELSGRLISSSVIKQGTVLRLTVSYRQRMGNKGVISKEKQ
jgi:hypothetical protein